MQTEFSTFWLGPGSTVGSTQHPSVGGLEGSLSCKRFIIEIHLLLLPSACKTVSNDRHPNSQKVGITPAISPVLYISLTFGLAACLLRYRDFLPRGSGIVTRRPLVLQLMNCPTGTTRAHMNICAGVFVFQVVLNLSFQTCYRFNENSHVQLQLSFIGLLWALPTSLF